MHQGSHLQLQLAAAATHCVCTHVCAHALLMLMQGGMSMLQSVLVWLQAVGCKLIRQKDVIHTLVQELLNVSTRECVLCLQVLAMSAMALLLCTVDS